MTLCFGHDRFWRAMTILIIPHEQQQLLMTTPKCIADLLLVQAVELDLFRVEDIKTATIMRANGETLALMESSLTKINLSIILLKLQKKWICCYLHKIFTLFLKTLLH